MEALGFHVPHHDLLPSEPLVAHPSTLLAVVWHVDVSAVQLRCRLRGDYRNYRIAVVPSAEGLLLCNSGSRLRDYSSAGDHSDGPTHSVSHAATHTPPPTPPPTRPTAAPAPIRPPAPPTAPPGPVDPYNCAVGTYFGWDQNKQTWCCSHHHICGQPTEPPRPADPYNCQDGFANWQAGWSVAKKEWCCRVHGKGCPNQGGGCVTSAEPYDCDAGFANWMAGWSVAKKAWCCSNKGKGCPPAAGGCA